MKLKLFYILKKIRKEEYTFHHIPSSYDYNLLAYYGISYVFSIKKVSEVIIQQVT